MSFGTHQKEYKIGGGIYTATAYFLGNTLVISNNTGTVYECSLQQYDAFEGNMEAYVELIIGLKRDGMSRSKIMYYLEYIHPHTAAILP